MKIKNSFINVRLISLVPIVIAVFLSGCYPAVTYKVASDDDYNIKDGQIIFGLRTTDITLVSAAKDDKSPDGCSGSGLDITPSKTWSQCLKDVSIQLTPSVEKPVYVAIPDNHWYTFRVKTKLAATSLNDERQNIDTVTVAYTDDTAQFVTNVGAGAVAGLAFGPAGAVIGGSLAAAGGVRLLSLNANITDTTDEKDWMNLICDDYTNAADKALYLKTPMDLAISLPFVISASDALKSSPPKCWHALPISAKSEALSSNEHLPWSGWVYRLILSDTQPKPEGAQTMEELTKNKYFSETTQTTFPYVPCQEVTLELAWWSELKTSVEQKTYSPVRRFFPIKIANPQYIRLADLPENGSIKLGAVCGAQVTFGSYTGSTNEAVVNAAIKSASDFKAAQEKAKPSKSKTN